MTKFPKVVVGAIIYNDKGEIFLAQSYKWKKKNKWCIPDGHVEWGESFKNAVKREVKEETNLDVKNIKFIDIYEVIFPKEFYKKRHFIFIDFCCNAVNSNVKLNNELQDYRWITPNKSLKILLDSSTRKTIKKLCRSR